MPSSLLQFRRPGLRTVGWALALVLAGTLLGFGLNAVTPQGINLKIALTPDTPDSPSPILPANGAKP